MPSFASGLSLFVLASQAIVSFGQPPDASQIVLDLLTCYTNVENQEDCSPCANFFQVGFIGDPFAFPDECQEVVSQCDCPACAAEEEAFLNQIRLCVAEYECTDDIPCPGDEVCNFRGEDGGYCESYECTDDIPCADENFCNFDYMVGGSCEFCSPGLSCANVGLPEKGVEDCVRVCGEASPSISPAPSASTPPSQSPDLSFALLICYVDDIENGGPCLPCFLEFNNIAVPGVVSDPEECRTIVDACDCPTCLAQENAFLLSEPCLEIESSPAPSPAPSQEPAPAPAKGGKKGGKKEEKKKKPKSQKSKSNNLRP